MKILRKIHIYLAFALSWFLFFICFFGTSGYFKDEINYYMQPNLAKSIKNTEHSELAQALEFAMKKYENYEFVGIKTPPYYSSLFEIHYYNKTSSKGEKKQNIAYFDGDEFIKTSTLGSKFLIGLHYKVLPSHGTIKTIFKAIISAIAAGLIVLLISGIFIWNKKLNSVGKSPYMRLYNFHILSGLCLSAFLFWLALSGIGINYIKDIENFFNPVEAKKYPAKAAPLKLYDFDPAAVLKASEDAKTRLKTEQIHIILSKPMKSILISKSKNDNPIKDTKTKNSNILFYSAAGELNEKISKNLSLKTVNSYGFLNELFYNTHRVPFAPLALKLSLALCGVLACIFIYKAMQMSAVRKKSAMLQALANSALYSSLNATLVYFIANKIISSDLAQRASYEQLSFCAAFFASILLSFVLIKKPKILKLLSLILFIICLISDALNTYYTPVVIAFNFAYIIGIAIILRSFYASANH